MNKTWYLLLLFVTGFMLFTGIFQASWALGKERKQVQKAEVLDEIWEKDKEARTKNSVKPREAIQPRERKKVHAHILKAHSNSKQSDDKSGITTLCSSSWKNGFRQSFSAMPTEECVTCLEMPLMDDVIGSIMSPDPYPDNATCTMWYIDVGKGYNVDLTIKMLDLDGNNGDYLIISPSYDEVFDVPNPVFSWYLNSERIIRIFDKGTAFILFVTQTLIEDRPREFKGFEIVYEQNGTLPTTTPITSSTAAVPTPPADIDVEIIVYLRFLRQPVDPIESFITIQSSFRRHVAMMSIDYCTRKKIEIAENPTYKNVFVTNLSPCQETWPNSGSCVQVKFGVALNTTSPNYELTKPHLQEMWDTMSGNGLADIGLEPYKLPSSILSWIGISVGVLALFCLILIICCWKSNVFHEYTSMEEPVEKTAENEKEDINDVFVPVPPQFGVQIFEPEYNGPIGANNRGSFNPDMSRPQSLDMHLALNDMDSNFTGLGSTDTSQIWYSDKHSGIDNLAFVEEEEDAYTNIADASKKISYETHLYDDPKLPCPDQFAEGSSETVL